MAPLLRNEWIEISVGAIPYLPPKVMVEVSKCVVRVVVSTVSMMYHSRCKGGCVKGHWWRKDDKYALLKHVRGNTLDGPIDRGLPARPAHRFSAS